MRRARNDRRGSRRDARGIIRARATEVNGEPRTKIVSAVVFATLCATSAAASAPGSEWAVASLPGGHEIRLEIAADERSRARGYSFRRSIAPDEGMLFLFDESGHHSFWMKDCFVPLDIIWLDERWRVLEIAADRPPCPADGPCPSLLPMRAARYVLELVGGSAARLGLEPGDRVDVLAEPPIP